MERRVEFYSEHQKVVGSLHLPDNFDRPYPCVVTSHGYKSNRNSEKYARVAKRFPLEGIAVLRLDHRGALGGESDGRFEDTTLTGRIMDLQAALAHVSTVEEIDRNRLGLLGSSLGGRVVLSVPKDERIRAIVTMAAPFSFPRQREEMKTSLKEKGYYEFPDGSRIKRDYYDDLQKYSLGNEIKNIVCPVLLIHGDLDEQVPRHNAFNLYRHANEPKKLVMIPGADHSFTDADKLDEALRLSLEWFKRYLLVT